MNHREECRQRIEEKMRVLDPERYHRTLGGLATGTLKERAGDERKAKDAKVQKELKPKGNW